MSICVKRETTPWARGIATLGREQERAKINLQAPLNQNLKTCAFTHFRPWDPIHTAVKKPPPGSKQATRDKGEEVTTILGCTCPAVPCRS